MMVLSDQCSTQIKTQRFPVYLYLLNLESILESLAPLKLLYIITSTTLSLKIHVLFHNQSSNSQSQKISRASHFPGSRAPPSAVATDGRKERKELLRLSKPDRWSPSLWVVQEENRCAVAEELLQGARKATAEPCTQSAKTNMLQRPQNTWLRLAINTLLYLSLWEALVREHKGMFW